MALAGSPAICLFLPTYNVAESIEHVLSSIPEAALNRVGAVLLVDNGSSDRTMELVRAHLRKHANPKFHLLLNERNYSLGGSTIVAFRWAAERGFDYVICMHSDGQADPSCLHELIAHSDGINDFVFGSRFLPGSELDSYPVTRRWGNLFFVQVQQRLFGIRVHDIGSFISFNMKTIGASPYWRLPADMGYHPMLVLYVAKKVDIRFYEFPMRWGRVNISNVNPFVYGVKHLWRLLQFSSGRFPMTDRELADFRSQEVGWDSAP